MAFKEATPNLIYLAGGIHSQAEHQIQERKGFEEGADMRVRVWIAGAEGPSRDFELVAAPRLGECISISVGGRFEEGIVTSVIWQLVGIERTGSDLTLGVEPVGSVTVVHVICHPPNDGERLFAEKGMKELLLE